MLSVVPNVGENEFHLKYLMDTLYLIQYISYIQKHQKVFLYEKYQSCIEKKIEIY